MLGIHDHEGETLQVVIALEGVDSMAEVELSVGAMQLQLQLANDAQPLVVPLPRRVDPDVSETAKFSRKTGQLKVTVRCASAAL